MGRERERKGRGRGRGRWGGKQEIIKKGLPRSLQIVSWLNLNKLLGNKILGSRTRCQMVG